MKLSTEHLRALLKFWTGVLGISLLGILLFSGDRMFSSRAESEPIVIDPASLEEIPTLFLPKIAEIVPVADTDGVLLDIEDPITVRFTDSVKPYHIRFELEPKVELVTENDPEKTEFRLLPKEPLRAGTRYTLNVSYVSRETPDAAYRPLTETSFTTLAPPPSVVAQENDTTTRLRGALSDTVARRMEGRYIDVNLAEQIMVLFEDGRAVQSYLISSGKRGMDTPKGEFSIHNKAPRPWSKAYGLYMPNWMAFTADGKFGIHELPEWPGGYKEGANHLGRPVSHGCIRLGVGAAQEVYDWTDTGTTVIIH